MGSVRAHFHQNLFFLFLSKNTHLRTNYSNLAKRKKPFKQFKPFKLGS